MNTTRYKRFLLFHHDKLAALNDAILEGERSLGEFPSLYISCRMLGKESRAGSYQVFRRADLENRLFEIEFIDDNVAIHFVDEVYDMRTFRKHRFPFI